MRTKLGLAVALTVLGTLAFVGSPAAGGTPEPDPSTTTTGVTTTIVDQAAPVTTTTTLPQNVADPIAPGPVRAGNTTPQRGTAVQLTPTLPPPPTTTTTTLPPADLLPANSGSGRRMVYSKSRQRVWAVDGSGGVLKTHLVSGRLTWNQPLPGTYSVFSRSSYTCNIKNPSICWRYMVRFAKGGDGDNIGFHEIPSQNGKKVQSIWQLGTPLSGGCVRQSTPDAQWVWGWAWIGTKVVVLQ